MAFGIVAVGSSTILDLIFASEFGSIGNQEDPKLVSFVFMVVDNP